MKPEEKQLLLKDLCARLPYGVKVSVSGDDFDNYQYPYLLTAISKFGQDILCKVYSPIYIPLGCPSIENVKPYLRPMSSMTEEEKVKYFESTDKDMDTLLDSLDSKFIIQYGCRISYGVVPYYETDWLLEHHFDYRGLIEKGLALEAPEGMYN